MQDVFYGIKKKDTKTRYLTLLQIMKLRNNIPTTNNYLNKILHIHYLLCKDLAAFAVHFEANAAILYMGI